MKIERLKSFNKKIEGLNQAIKNCSTPLMQDYTRQKLKLIRAFMDEYNSVEAKMTLTETLIDQATAELSQVPLLE